MSLFRLIINKIWRCSLVCLFGCIVYGQESIKISHTSEEVQQQEFQQLADQIEYWIREDKDSFFYYMAEFKALSAKYRSVNGYLYYNRSMADYYFLQNVNRDSAIWYSKRNIRLHDSLGYYTHNILASYYTLGIICKTRQDYAKAYLYFKKAYNKFAAYPEVAKLRDSILLLRQILDIQFKMGMMKDVLQSTHTLVQLVERNPEDKMARGAGNTYIGNMYEKLHNDSFIVYLKKAHYNLIREDSNGIEFYHALQAIIKQYLRRQQADSALPYLMQFEKYYNLPRSYNPPKDLDFYLHYLEYTAQYHYIKKDYTKALHIIQSVYDSCKKYNNYDFVVHILPLMSDIYEKAGLLHESLAYTREYSRLNDSIYRTQLNLIYETQYQDQMDFLKTDIQEKDHHIELQTKTLQSRNYIIFFIAFGLVILCILVYTLSRNLKLKERFRKEELERLNTQHQLENLASKIGGIEEERKRLAVDLHDGVANELWALQLQLNHFSDKISGQSPVYRTLLEQYQNHLSNVMEDVRNLAKNLRPSLLMQTGLGTAIWKLCERVNTNQAQLSISCSIDEAIPRFEESIELSIYRIVQEIVQNAIKHAKGADTIDVQILYSDKDLNITIEDNGSGMPENFVLSKESNGLANIYDRVKLLNGEISYLSYPGEGTCFTINFYNLETNNHNV